MRALHLFLTISLSLSAAAYEDIRLQRRDAIPVSRVGISNRDLSVLPRSNMSDANSLNMDSERALDDHRLVPRKRVLSGMVKVTIDRGLFTVDAQFQDKLVSKVILDTNSSMTWTKLDLKSTQGAVDFTVWGLFPLHGHMTRGTVKLQKGLTALTQFATVPNQATGGYGGGIALDRSHTSWAKLTVNNIPQIFAFYIFGNAAEFHFGKFDDRYHKDLEWHKVERGNSWTLEQKAHIKVDGVVTEAVEAFSTTIHSGASFIYANGNDVRNVYKQIKDHKFLKFGKFPCWMVPCDEQPEVSFSWGGRDFLVADRFLTNQHTEADGKKYCRGMLRTLPHLPEHNFVLGTIFIKGKYVAFNGVDEEVGFLELVHSESVHTR